MKKYIQYMVFGLVLASLLMFISCKRSDVTDPAMDNNAGYFINLSGVANPSTLFLYIGCDPQMSTIKITALYNNGEPVKNRDVFLIIKEIELSGSFTLIGYFNVDDKKKNSMKITTNDLGVAYANYYVDKTDRDRVTLEQIVEINGYIESDLYPKVYEVIIIKVLSDYQG